jgi:AraC family transcriptional regulator
MDSEPGKGRSSPGGAQVILSSEGRGWEGLEADFLRIPAGPRSCSGSEFHRITVHFGRSVNTEYRYDRHWRRRAQSHGDVGIAPAGLEGICEDDADSSLLLLRLTPALLRQVAEGLDGNADKVALQETVLLRDPRLEAVAWAIKAELESEVPSDRLYAESLAVALAVRLIEGSDQVPRLGFRDGPTLSAQQRERLADFIESHIQESLSLADLAEVAGLSVSHFKMLFSRTFGMPAHQYVVYRRVERAKLLLLSGRMSLSDVAHATGFAHQSHMGRCMRKFLGLTPSALLKLRD